MTAFTLTTAPIAVRRSSLRHVRLPEFGVGRFLTVLSGGIMRAYELAYVAPYGTMRVELPMAPDADLEGRDPNW